MKKLLLILFSISISIICVEFTIEYLSLKSYRFKVLTYNPRVAKGAHKIDTLEKIKSTTTFALPAGTLINGFVTNSGGFLSPEIPYAKDNNTLRILLIGDSFAVGVVPYPKNFIRIVEKKLNESGQFKKRIEVINLGISGIGPATYERLLSVEGLKYNPDLVIVSFFVGNDFTDDVILKSKIDKEEYKKPAKWFDKIALFNLIRNLLLVTRFSKSLNVATPTNGDKLGTYTGQGVENYEPLKAYPDDSMEAFLEQIKSHLYIFIKEYGAFDNDFSEVKETLSEIKNICNQNQKPLLFLIFPDQLQTNKQLLESVESSEEAKRIDNDLAQRELSEFFQAENIEYIDVLPDFKKLEKPEELYQPIDTHFNSIGNEEVAKIIYQPIFDKLKESNN